jgi:hypothetical protein
MTGPGRGRGAFSRRNLDRTGALVRYVNLDLAPLWECCLIAALSVAFMVWRTWTLHPPAVCARAGGCLAVTMLAATCSGLARHDSFGHGVELAALAAVSFGVASIGKMDALRAAAARDRERARNPIPEFMEDAETHEADRAAVTVALRILGVAVALWLANWLLVTRVH